MNDYQIMSRGSQDTIDNTPIKDGKLRLAMDTARLFFDVNDETRIEITDFVKGFTYSELLNLESPLPKIYLTSDSFQFMIYDHKFEKWKTIGAGGDVATHAIYDKINQRIDSTYIKNIIFVEDGTILLVLGNDETIEIDNPYFERKIDELNQRIADLESLVHTYIDKIDLLKQNEMQE